MPKATVTESGTGSFAQTCIIVTGMHCGETSILSHILTMLGANVLTTSALEVEGGRVTALTALNDDVLKSAGTSWASGESINSGWYETPQRDAFVQRARALIDTEFARSAFFLLDDPRLCRLLPFWTDVLDGMGITVRIAAIHRQPDDVAASLAEQAGFALPIGRLLWLRNMLDAERDSRDARRAFVSFDALLADWRATTNRLASDLALSWPAASQRTHNQIDDFLLRIVKRYSSRALDRPTPGDWVGDTAATISGWCGGAVPSGEDLGRLDKIRRDFDQAMTALGGTFDVSVELTEETARLRREIGDLAVNARSVVGAAPDLPSGRADAAGLERATRSLATQLDQMRAMHAHELERVRAEHLRELPEIEKKWARSFTSTRLARERLTEQNDAFQRSISAMALDIAALREELDTRKQELAQSETLALVREAELRAESGALTFDLSDLRQQLSDQSKEAKQAAEAMSTNIASLRGELKAQKNEAARSAKSASSREARATELQNRLNAMLAARDETIAAYAAIHRSPVVRTLRALRLIKRAPRGGAGSPPTRGRRAGGGLILSPMALLSPKARRKAAQLRTARDVIGNSPMFDAQWYLAKNPDVRESGLDPLDHYILFGGAEGRSPSEAFAGGWYLRTHDDVRDAGLNPLLHFLEHGRDEGRAFRTVELSGRPGHQVDAAPSIPASARAANGQPSSAAAEAARPINATPVVPPQPVISEFDHGWKAQPQIWSANAGAKRSWTKLDDLKGLGPNASIRIGTLVVARYSASEPGAPMAPGALDRLMLLAMLRPDIPAAERAMQVGGDIRAAAAPHVLLTSVGLGLDLMSDGWFANEFALRLRIDTLGRPAIAGTVVRAMQFRADGSAVVCGEQPLGYSGSDILEIALDNPLLAVALLVTTDDGWLIDSAILPYPSLARGGSHYGELAAMEAAPGYWETLCAYTHSLALEQLGWPEGPGAPSIGACIIDMRGATGIEPVFKPHAVAALATQFSMIVEPDRATAGATNHAGQLLAQHLSVDAAALTTGAAPLAKARAENSALRLALPPDALPSLYALTARRFRGRLSQSTFCMAEAASGRPLYLAAIPVPADGVLALQNRQLPIQYPLVVGQEAVGEDAPATAAPPMLAVRFFEPQLWDVDPLLPTSPDQPSAIDRDDANAPPAQTDAPHGMADSATPLVSVLVHVRSARTPFAETLTAIARQTIVDRVEIIVAGTKDALANAGSTAAFGVPHVMHLCETDGLSHAQALNAAAMTARGTYLLIVDADVLLTDVRTIETLVALSAADPGAASVSCPLIAQVQSNGHVDLRLHSSGYFPARISFNGEPAFEFEDISISAILPATTFPVAANHMRCTLIPSAVWRELDGLAAKTFPVNRFDLDFGLRAMASGRRNYCTSLVRAAADGRCGDYPDPLAGRLIGPIDWQALCRDVTIIRELRR